uniref:Secreted protein n=1 Tax=Arundo donax TaxID=35708 RepID=A0A0A9DSN3_ARUDO
MVVLFLFLMHFSSGFTDKQLMKLHSGIATISPSSTWMSSLSTTNVSAHCTSRCSHQNTCPISLSSGYQLRPSSSSHSSWNPSGSPPSCRGQPRCRARTYWPPCRGTTGGWRRPGGRSATRTRSGLNGWST